MNTHIKIKQTIQPGPNESNGWMYFLGTVQPDQVIEAGQASDTTPTIKSAEHTVIKPEISIMVEQALKLNPYMDNSSIRVLSQGSRIILTGKVRSWFQKEEAGRVAKLASGNLNVINDIAISYYA